MSIPDMQRYSLVYSENNPSLCLGRSFRGNGASAQVIQSLWSISLTRSQNPLAKIIKRQRLLYPCLAISLESSRKYADLLELIGESFPGEYYKKFCRFGHSTKTGLNVAEALKWDAIVS